MPAQRSLEVREGNDAPRFSQEAYRLMVHMARSEFKMPVLDLPGLPGLRGGVGQQGVTQPALGLLGLAAGQLRDTCAPLCVKL